MKFIQIGITASFVVSGAYAGWCVGVIVSYYAARVILTRSLAVPGATTLASDSSPSA